MQKRKSAPVLLVTVAEIGDNPQVQKGNSAQGTPVLMAEVGDNYQVCRMRGGRGMSQTCGADLDESQVVHTALHQGHE